MIFLQIWVWPLNGCSAGVQNCSHGADEYDQEPFRHAAVLAFKPGGEEVDVGSTDNIYPAQCALLELLVSYRKSTVQCFGSAMKSSSRGEKWKCG